MSYMADEDEALVTTDNAQVHEADKNCAVLWPVLGLSVSGNSETTKSDYEASKLDFCR